MSSNIFIKRPKNDVANALREQAEFAAMPETEEVVSPNLFQPLSPSDIIITRLDAIKEDASKITLARKVAWIARVHDDAYGWRISEYRGSVAGIEYFDATGEAYDSLDSAERIAACAGYTHVRLMTKTGYLTTRKVRKAFTSAATKTPAIAPQSPQLASSRTTDRLVSTYTGGLSLGQASIVLSSLECV